MLEKYYPLKFQPIFEEKIWGGNKLKSVLNKKTVADSIGESWEISNVEGKISMVANGSLKGQTLQNLLNNYTSDLIGTKNYSAFGNRFPLLIKFIDAQENLSIQLHPNNKLARNRHNSFGKTEMWYVMHANPHAKLVVGFNQDMTAEKYKTHLNNGTLLSILNFDTAKPGDSYFIEAGRVHAIGSGILLAEIQQTSDITYRVYDWDRVDDNGNSRELHNDMAIDAINFNLKNDFRIEYTKQNNDANQLVTCPHFTTNYLPIKRGTITKYNTFDSFIIYICVEGEAAIQANGFTVTINKGETLLLPAAIKTFQISAKSAQLLEVYI